MKVGIHGRIHIRIDLSLTTLSAPFAARLPRRWRGLEELDGCIDSAELISAVCTKTIHQQGTRSGDSIRMFRRLLSWGMWLTGKKQPPPTTYRCEKCGTAATQFVNYVHEKKITNEHCFCRKCAPQNLWIPNPNPPQAVPSVSSSMHEALMEVERVFCYSDSWEQYIILKEVNGPRRLTLTTGYLEISALWHFLKGEPRSRPLTYDSWLNTVIALGAKAESVCVHDRREEVYFAEIRLLRGDERIKVDARPSDALLFALHAGAPFYFAEQVLARYSVSEPES